MTNTRPRRIVTLVGSSMAWREQVMAGIAGYAHEHGPWHVYTAPEGFEDTLFFSKGYQWDGVIARVTSRRLARAIQRLGVPAVNLSQHHINGVDLPRVGVDERGHTQLALQHLLSGGFRRFAYCGFSAAPEQRGRAFAQLVKALRYDCTDYHHFARLPDDVDWQRRQRELVRWIKQLAKPVGILAWNTDTACQLVEACNLAGVKVPDAVAIIAGDDDKMKCELCDPTVSAVEFPARQIGYEAAALLDRLISGKHIAQPHLIVEASGIITVRQSSDAASLADRDVHRAVQFIRDRAAQDIDVSQVAQHLQVSRRWLERHFQRALSRSPNDEIRRARLELAKRYLLETDWPTARIAKGAGLRSASYLNRVFRQEMGLTPGAFRNRYRPG